MASLLTEYMSAEEPPPFIIEEDPYLIEDQDPYIVKMETLDPEAPATPVYKTLSLRDIQNIPEPEWLAANWMQTDSFAVLFGAPGSGKSFWALDLSLSVATGVPFQGNAVKQGKVLMAAGEGLSGLRWRVEAWMMAHPEAKEEDIMSNFHVIPQVPHLLEKSSADRFLNTAEKLAEDKANPLRLCVVDTWARGMVNGDENSQKDAGIAIESCEHIRRITGASVLIVHHTGVDGTRERGSTALRGAADTSVMVQRDETTKVVSVTLKKMKDGESGMQSLYSLNKWGHSVVLTPFGGLIPQQQEQRDRDYYARRAAEKKASAF
jgi:hypothetical protein